MPAAAQPDLTDGGIRAAVRRMAAPAAMGFFCHTVYNLTDSFYAGFISTAAQSALGFSFPLYFIVLSACVGIGQALTARMANAIGRRRMPRALYFLGQGVALSLAVCLLIWLLLLPFVRGIVGALGASGEAQDGATAYSALVYAGAPLFLLSFLFNSALQSIGNTTAFRNSVVAAALLNIVLDPIFMFGWLGLPALGIQGVAIATLISQALGGAYLFWVFSRQPIAARWRAVFLRPRAAVLWQLARQTFAPAGRMLGIGLFFFLATGFLGQLADGTVIVAAYSIALRIEQMVLLPTIGLEVALLAYAGQALAKGRLAQTRAAYWLCVRYGLICMGAGGALSLALGGFLVGLFNDNPDVIAHGWRYLIAAAFIGPLYLFINLGGAVLMGALKTRDIALVSFMRLLALPLLLFSLLAHTLGLGATGVWMGIFLANLPAAWWMHRQAAKEFNAAPAPTAQTR